MVRTRRSRVVCVLFPEFETLDVVLFSSALERAGRRFNHRAFEFELCATAPGSIPGSSHPLEAVSDLANSGAHDVLFVPGGRGALDASAEPTFVAALSALAASSQRICAVGNAQYLLATAALLDGQRAAVNPTLATKLSLAYPTVSVDSVAPWVRSERFLLGSSSLSALDLALELIRDTLGSSEASWVASDLGRVQSAVRVVTKPE
jgi:transcriptional regulator GlxA family with amidase domain